MRRRSKMRTSLDEKKQTFEMVHLIKAKMLNCCRNIGALWLRDYFKGNKTPNTNQCEHDLLWCFDETFVRPVGLKCNDLIYDVLEHTCDRSVKWFALLFWKWYIKKRITRGRAKKKEKVKQNEKKRREKMKEKTNCVWKLLPFHPIFDPFNYFVIVFVLLFVSFLCL